MKQPKPAQQAAQQAAPTPPKSERAERPWYRTPGWWDGLTHAEIYDRVRTVDEPAAAILVPSGFLRLLGYLDQARPEVLQPLTGTRALSFNAVADRAWAICMELVRRDGYSTQHVGRAWEMAVTFAQAEYEQRGKEQDRTVTVPREGTSNVDAS